MNSNNDFAKSPLLESEEDDLKTLRSLLFDLNEAELELLKKWVQNPESSAIEVHEHIIKAIRSEKIKIEEISFLLETALENSVKHSPGRVANILFPVIMPAIRKAIADAMSKMLETINNTLENSLSIKRLFWRLQSMLSSKSYAEIVLSKSILYQVKQVFLIHKESGILLKEINEGKSHVKDNDMVSAMLTAIKDFVSDSLSSDEDQALNIIRVSGYDILIEHGPYAVIAGIVEGKTSSEIKEIFQNTNESIHQRSFQDLKNFDGDVSKFDDTEELLNQCLKSELKETRKRPPYVPLILLSVLLIGVGYFAYKRIEKNDRWNKYIEEVSKTPGIIILDESFDFNSYRIKGLKDPITKHPDSILKSYDIDSEKVKNTWMTFQSNHPALTLERAYHLLNPEKGVKLKLRNDTLFVEGRYSETWRKKASILYRSIYGIKNINLLPKKENIKKRIEQHTEHIENHYFNFDYNTSKLNDNQKIKLYELITEIQELLSLIKNSEDYSIQVCSYTSRKGNTKANYDIAYKRTLSFIDQMMQYDIAMNILKPKVLFIEDVDSNFDIRTVSFKVVDNK